MGEDLRLLREHASQPVLETLHEYLEKIREEVLPKSEAGQAVAYAPKNWTALTRYLEDGDLSIDNNHTERSLRGIAIGRHNWTFVGSDRGGKTMAELRGVVRTGQGRSVRLVPGRAHSFSSSTTYCPTAGPQPASS